MNYTRNRYSVPSAKKEHSSGISHPGVAVNASRTKGGKGLVSPQQGKTRACNPDRKVEAPPQKAGAILHGRLSETPEPSRPPSSWLRRTAPRQIPSLDEWAVTADLCPASTASRTPVMAPEVVMSHRQEFMVLPAWQGYGPSRSEPSTGTDKLTSSEARLQPVRLQAGAQTT